MEGSLVLDSFFFRDLKNYATAEDPAHKETSGLGTWQPQDLPSFAGKLGRQQPPTHDTNAEVEKPAGVTSRVGRNVKLPKHL